jgi:hypothetical protein
VQAPAASSAATISALLLLAVAGGFLFAHFCYLTRFAFRRMEGHQIYLASAAAAVLLLVLSRLVFYAFKYGVLGQYYGADIRRAWTSFLGPLEMPGLLATFGGAFLLGPICALLVNRLLFSSQGVSYFAVTKYGSELEEFAYNSLAGALPVSITLDNRKVYVGWVADVPVVEHREGVEDYLGIIPLRSGYRDNVTLQLHLTTQYEQVYERISREGIEKPDGQPLRLRDFVIVLAVDRIVSIGLHALDRTKPLLDANSFALSQTTLIKREWKKIYQ